MSETEISSYKIFKSVKNIEVREYEEQQKTMQGF